jgi:hypothetical protein
MKIHLRFLFISLFCWISGISGQSAVNLSTIIDTTAAGLEIPVKINILNDIRPDSIKIFIASYEAFKNIPGKIKASDLRSADFEIDDFGKWQGSVNTLIPGDRTVSLNEIQIRLWDEGRFIIIPLVNNQDEIETGGNSVSEFPVIFISPSINPNDSIKALAPIKDIIREEKNLSDHLSWYHYALLVYLLVLISIFIYTKFKKRIKTDFKDINVPVQKLPHIEALEKLALLKNEKIWLNGRVKEFHEQLTYILREYLEKKYEFNALEQSTYEIINSVELKISDKNQLITISDILQIADLIKFAKASIDEDLNEKFLNKSIDLVSILQ